MSCGTQAPDLDRLEVKKRINVVRQNVFNCCEQINISYTDVYRSMTDPAAFNFSFLVPVDERPARRQFYRDSVPIILQLTQEQIFQLLNTKIPDPYCATLAGRLLTMTRRLITIIEIILERSAIPIESIRQLFEELLRLRRRDGQLLINLFSSYRLKKPAQTDVDLLVNITTALPLDCCQMAIINLSNIQFVSILAIQNFSLALLTVEQFTERFNILLRANNINAERSYNDFVKVLERGCNTCEVVFTDLGQIYNNSNSEIGFTTANDLLTIPEIETSVNNELNLAQDQVNFIFGLLDCFNCCQDKTKEVCPNQIIVNVDFAPLSQTQRFGLVSCCEAVLQGFNIFQKVLLSTVFLEVLNEPISI
jgi:hypothetical protein